MTQNTPKADPYNGLLRAEPTLPARCYLDEEEHARDLDAIWYRNWVMICRAAELAEPLAWRTFRIGIQPQ